MKIFKYELEVTDYQRVQMPALSRVLCAQVQRSKLCIWVQVNPDQPMIWRNFYVFGTGNPIDSDFPDLLDYVGTVQIGAFVWHVFVS